MSDSIRCFHIGYRWIGNVGGNAGVGAISLITHAPNMWTATAVKQWIRRLTEEIEKHHNANEAPDRHSNDILITSITNLGPGQFE